MKPETKITLEAIEKLKREIREETKKNRKEIRPFTHFRA